HGHAPDFLTNDETRERVPMNLSDRLHLALFVADKMTANGYDVLRRRPSFVAGERLHKSDGDLQQFGFQPDKDELLVVAMESAIRLGFINPQSLYPRKLQHVVAPLYDIQRDFVKGVYKAAGVTNHDLAHLLLGIGQYAERRKDGKSMVEYLSHKFTIPEEIGIDADKLAVYLSQKTGITDESILQTPDNIVDGAKETVIHFSSQYQRDLDELSHEWEPDSAVAKQWKQGMDEYASGAWFEKMMATL
ncbi:MAG TPA: hypothetical protein VLF20_03095, partial [Patescibacteria group bacterium]|nr:hypothetical protein [Patescibacteria group bacterium]